MSIENGPPSLEAVLESIAMQRYTSVFVEKLGILTVSDLDFVSDKDLQEVGIPIPFVKRLRRRIQKDHVANRMLVKRSLSF